MNELKAILDAADSATGPMFLATVVDVDGSAYRRPGARMLILPNGERVGMISGGCLERDLCRQAAMICQNGSRLISFDTRSESANFNARYNLGCSGLIYILVEPITNDSNCPLHVIRDVMSSGESATIGTVYQSSNMDCLSVGDRFFAGQFISEAVDNQLRETFIKVANTGKPICCQLIDSSNDDDSSARIFVEKLFPPKPFWIFGSGDDAIPMANIAHELGWSVTVVDDKPGNLSASRFPNSKRLLATDFRKLEESLVSTPETTAVLMTHSFTKDAAVLPWLCKANLSYIGLLGPKSRTGMLLKRIYQCGESLEPTHLECLHTPVGLDIGGTGPAQIAISVAAEIIALDNNRRGNFLSLRQAPIHEPVSHQLVNTEPTLIRD